jgi:glutamyl-Q tRNA(Asp) synthetase
VAAIEARAGRPAYRGRFAPSPTGPLHFGSLIAALASHADALAARGEWLVRIEDVDLPRTRHGAETAILGALERYGFAWAGPVVRQSGRTAHYEAALRELIARGDAYQCACTRRELEAAPPDASGERIYPGTCRTGIPSAHTRRTQRSWRVRVGLGNGGGAIEYRDRVLGAETQLLPRDVGDFVVKRADGFFAYQLAVVVDDATQGITDVVRGADLRTSTPRQIFLQQRLGYPTPAYLHVPVATNAAGEKLSKQTRAAPLPVAPLGALLEAWGFLDQPLPESAWKPANVGEFWTWVARAWAPSRVPRIAMLPVPGAIGMEMPEPV